MPVDQVAASCPVMTSVKALRPPFPRCAVRETAACWGAEGGIERQVLAAGDGPATVRPVCGWLYMGDGCAYAERELSSAMAMMSKLVG